MATGQDIADEARGDLNDEDAAHFRWSDAKVLRYVNAAARAIVALLPSANVVEEAMALEPGTRQVVPTGGVKFLGLYNQTGHYATLELGAFTAGAGGDSTSDFQLVCDDDTNTLTVSVSNNATVTIAQLAAAFVTAGFVADGTGTVNGYTLDLGDEVTITAAITAGSLTIVRADGANFTYVETLTGTAYGSTVPTFADAPVETEDGSTPILRGAAVTVVEEDALNSSFPAWPTGPVDPDVVGTVLHITHDPRDPKVFGVYPPVQGAFNAYIKHSKNPTAMTDLADDFPLGDEYINGAVEYTKYRMMGVDGRFGGSPERRLEQWNNFRMALGLKPELEKRVDPARGRAGADDNG